MAVTKGQAREIIFNYFKSSRNLNNWLQANNPPSYGSIKVSSSDINMLLEVCTEFMVRGLLYQCHESNPTIYRLTEKGKLVISENWTDTTTTENFVADLKSEGLLFDSQLEQLIFEFNQAHENRLEYSANLVLTLASEKALDKIMAFTNSQFGGKLVELDTYFSSKTLPQRKILNFANSMHQYRNSYAHLDPIKFNFTTERQNFVNYLKNIKQITT